MLVEEGNFAQGDFVIYSLLELYLRSANKVVFIGSSQSFAHYEAVMKKLVATRWLFFDNLFFVGNKLGVDGRNRDVGLCRCVLGAVW